MSETCDNKNDKHCKTRTDTKKNLFGKTPLIESVQLSKLCPNKVYLKLENCHPSGSFKFRGLSKACQHAFDKGCKEVVTSSGGNAGLAVAVSARLLGLKCRTFVPKTTSEEMKSLIEMEGAKVEGVGNVWDEAHKHALKISNDCKTCYYVHPFDDPIIWSGHSTMIDEIAEDLGKTIPSMIISSCGGGGLICGIIEGMRRHGWTSVPVLAMETTGANSLNAAIKSGTPVKPVVLKSITSIAKSLGALAICQQLADDYNKSSPPIVSHLLEDRDAADACLKFADHHRILVEPACGVSLAALYTGLVKKLFDQNKCKYSSGPVVVIVCGGCSVTLDLLQQWKNKFKL